LRLFACACCRLIWGHLRDERSQRAVETAERFADGLANAYDLGGAHQQAREAEDAVPITPTEWTHVLGTGGRFEPNKLRSLVARAAASAALPEASEAAQLTAWAVERAALEAAMTWHDEKAAASMAGAAVRAGVLRDIFGNPFRRLTLAPSCLTWRDGLIRSMAATIYEERRYEDLPVLADALEEAGCTNRAVLRHCRGRNVHVRGCWVVDLILARE
jgi:hypothetical protein